MTTYIEYTEGKVYDVAHLRPFNLELAKCGHPLAWRDGIEISFMSETSLNFFWVSVWDESIKKWQDDCDYLQELSKRIRLAPLSIKDGKPLHVGDLVEWHGAMGDIAPWRKGIVSLKNINVILDEFRYRWRWPVEASQ
jgi:hypothetical protein